jgi:hypothetical protein
MMLNQGTQRSLRKQRHIAAQDDQVTLKVRKRLVGTQNRMSGTELPFLDHPFHITFRIGTPNRIGAVANDHDYPLWAKLPSRL